MSNEKLIQLQFALFFANLDNRPDKFINKIDDALDVFDQMPTIVQIPDDAPAEIPRVTMQSSNGLFICNISQNRIDLIMNCVQTGDSIAVSLDQFIKKVIIFSEVVFNTKNIVRFGFVGRYFIRHANPIKKIQTKYFKNDLGDLSDIGLKFNKLFIENNLNYNDLVEINQGSAIENNGPQQVGIMLVRDMNNVPVGQLRMEDMLHVINKYVDKFKLSGISELI